MALAVITQPVSAPVSIPVPTPSPTPSPTPTPSPIATSSATLSVTPSVIPVGGKFSFSWSGIPDPMIGDYILVYNSNNVKQDAEFWTGGCDKLTLDPGRASGTCANIPIYINNPGTYYMILYSNHSNNNNMPLARSNTFTVVPAPVCLTLTIEGLQAAFGTKRGDPRFNPCYDANNDGKIDIVDFSILLTVFQALPKPDLTVDLKANVENIDVGTSASLSKKITLTATVKNIGSSSAQPSVTQINTNYSNEYWRLATNSLNPGASQVLTITTYKNPGSYQFTAKADADSQVNESNEDNNSASATVVIPTAKPDLIVLSASASGELKVGSYNNLNIVVKNQGNADAKSFWVSANTLDLTTGNQLGYCYAYVDKLAAGQTITAQINNCKQYKYPGQQRIYGKVDEFNMIDESNETNNTYTAYVNVINPAPKADYITPLTGLVGSIASVYGSNFGNKQGNVTFYNQWGQASGKAPILGWYDGGVKFRILTVAKGTYSVEIQTSDGKKSNKVSFTVIAGQPTISSLYTYKLSWGGYFIIYGRDLGNSGKINLYNIGSNVPFYNASILYWSDSLIMGQISPKVGGNATYGIQVSTSDNRNSSIIYRYISK